MKTEDKSVSGAGQRKLSFPDVSVGQLRVSTKDNGAISENQLVDAAGGVVVPAGARVELSIFNHHEPRIDLSFLSDMREDDLDSLLLYGDQIMNPGPGFVKELKGLRRLGFILATITDNNLEFIGGLLNLEELSLVQCPLITSAGLLHMVSLMKLEELRLSSTKIDDEGLVYLKDLPALQRLFLRLTSVSDAGLPILETFQNLRELELSGTNVTDKGLAGLAKLRSLKKLYLEWSRISYEGLKILHRLLPECVIYTVQNQTTGEWISAFLD
jgi:hypothetical protein